MEKNNINSNSISNAEMYKKSKHHVIESVDFYTAYLDLVKEKTTFAKSQNGTIARLLYSSYSNAANYYEKVDGRWLKLNEERAKKIRNAINKKANEIENAKNIVTKAIEWIESDEGQKHIENFQSCDAIADGNIDEHTYVYTVFDGHLSTIDFCITFDGDDISTQPDFAESLDNCFSYDIEDLDADEIANELAIWAIDIANDDRVVYKGLKLRSNLGDIYEVVSVTKVHPYHYWEWCVRMRDISSGQEVNCIDGKLQWTDEEEYIDWEARVEVCEETQDK